MTPQEEQMLEGLTERINSTQLPEKDDQAEQMLQQKLARNPDALYILAQTVLVQQYALEQSQKQLADLKAQLEQARQAPPPEPKHATSFLGSLLGHHDEPAPPPPPPYAPVPSYGTVPQYAPVPQYPPQYPPAPQYAPQYGAPQQGGFLRSAMQTATGVAAGALAFEGIESLMHGFGHAAGYGSDFGGGFGGVYGAGRPEEVINNYYGDSAPGHSADSLSPDIDDRRGDSAFSGAVDSGDHGFTAPANDYVDTENATSTDQIDNSSADDTPSFDSGSTFDSSDSSTFDSGDSGGGFDSGGGDGSSF